MFQPGEKGKKKEKGREEEKGKEMLTSALWGLGPVVTGKERARWHVSPACIAGGEGGGRMRPDDRSFLFLVSSLRGAWEQKMISRAVT